jgi:hypothetical protein
MSTPASVNYTWSTGFNSDVGYMACDNTYMYFPNSNAGNIARINLSDGTIDEPAFISSLTQPSGCLINGAFLYVCSNSSTIGKYNLSDGTTVDANWASVTNVWSMVTDGTDIYTANRSSSTISQVNLNTATVVQTWASLGGTPYQIAINGGYLYVASYTGQCIYQVQISDPTVVVTWFSSPTSDGLTGISINLGYVYVSGYGDSKITLLNLSDAAVVNSSFVSGLPEQAGMSLIQNYLYVFCYTTQVIAEITLDAPTAPCFHEDSKILTINGYEPIKNLRKGDLIKTLKHGFVPIDMIGKREIYHPSSKERIKEQLYKCSKDQYPELTEDLILTGCHSILVDKFTSEEQREKTIQVNGDTYVTDRKYRLPACADDRTSVYEIPGNYTIYHLALENDDYYMNYGIYANELLVETCSKRYLKELSNMNLIE